MATIMPIRQFIKAGELSPGLFDRPYFVAPKDEVQAKALSIMRKASRKQTLWGLARLLLAVANTWLQLGFPGPKAERSDALSASVRR
jgi:DNA end-binding protein Ku